MARPLYLPQASTLPVSWRHSKEFFRENIFHLIPKWAQIQQQFTRSQKTCQDSSPKICHPPSKRNSPNFKTSRNLLSPVSTSHTYWYNWLILGNTPSIESISNKSRKCFTYLESKM